ncbi:hypothetical protein NT6N_07140 [Oceaniferula spumae]|uniref:Methyltransferase domain-containing protein n=1 Tax=Oceaniferula spumae TaxID=2979115 RepID=A0AAT9FI75_9BACT
MSATLRYNQLAPIYDVGIVGDLFYRAARREAIDRLNLTLGSRVMVLFCGTGFDFGLIIESIGETGMIYAVDGAAGMLKRAQKRSRRLELSNDQIKFVQADFSKSDDVAKLCEIIREVRPDRLLISMGMNCMAEWKPFFSYVFEALEIGTRVSMFDLYTRKLNVRARLLNGVGAGDCRRKIWEELESRSSDFSFHRFKSEGLLGVPLFTASGSKPAAASELKP